MSDLFARLIDRARGTAPVIRPRVPTAFEMAADSTEALAESHDAVERTPVATTRQPGGTVPESRPPAASDGNDDNRATTSPRESVSPPPPLPVQRADAPEVREVVRTAHSPRDAPAPTAASGPPAGPQADTAPTEAGTTGEADRQIVERTVARVREEHRIVQGDEPRSGPPNPGTRVEPTGVRAVRPDPRNAPPETPAAAPPVDAGPPVIRVTIGRVDVRAVPSAPPAPAPAPVRSSRRMSLEDYLRRRNGDA